MADQTISAELTDIGQDAMHESLVLLSSMKDVLAEDRDFLEKLLLVRGIAARLEQLAGIVFDVLRQEDGDVRNAAELRDLLGDARA